MEVKTARPRGRKPVTALRLLAEIERDQRETGACTASTRELAARVGRKERQVYEALAQLRASGHIVREPIPHPEHPALSRRRLRLPEP